MKLSHALSEHQGLDCQTIGKVHIHKVELDCDFQKFKLSPQFYPTLSTVSQIVTITIKKKNTDLYSFLSKFQILHFDLRGPPTVS